MEISNNQIALAGEFAALSQLALRGFDANLTLGNAKGVDILLSHSETGSMYRLEVKTHTHNRINQSSLFGTVVASWHMGEKHEHDDDPKRFYCFVSIADDTQSFDFYIVPSAVVAKFVKESHQLWLSTSTDHKDTDMRKFMLTDAPGQCAISVPVASDYHGKWDLLK